MTQWFYGDDRRAIERAIERLAAGQERLVVDAETVAPADFWAHLTVGSLFGSPFLVVKDLLRRTDLLENFIQLAADGFSVPVAFWDEKVDKRSKLYKVLAPRVKFVECKLPALDEKAVFRLLEAALEGRVATLEQDLRVVAQNSAPVAVSALISSQLFNLIAVLSVRSTPDKLAKELGVHPFALQGLVKYRGRITRPKWEELLAVACETDRLLKTVGVDSWLLLRQMFYRFGAIVAAEDVVPKAQTL